jgi:integrase/recombinase XerD
MGRQSRVSNVLVKGPLAPFADAYRRVLEDRGYSALSAVNLQRQVAHLSSWLDARGLGAEHVAEECIQAFLADQRFIGRSPSSLSRPGLVCLLELLGDLGVVSAAVPPVPSPSEELIEAFRRYLVGERGLAAGTVVNYVDGARRFVARRGATELSAVTPAEVIAAVLARSTAVSVSATQNYVASLRSFLRFCFLEGVMDSDISEAALPITGRRRSPSTTPTRCSHPVIAAPRSAGATTRSSSRCCAWACVGVRSRR